MVLAQWHAHRLALLAEDNVYTVTSVVYVTATGPVSSSSAEPTVSSTTRTVYNAPSRQVRPTSSVTSTSTTASETASSSGILAPTTLTSSSVPTSLLVASTSSLAAAPLATQPLTIASTTESHGMSGGAKAGLAIGIVIIVGILAALGVFLYRRKKQSDNQDHARLDDEKSEMRQASTAAESKSVAPRLSLRPITQIFASSSEKQNTGLPTASPRALTPEPVSAEPANPFGDDAAEKAAIPAPAPAAAAPVPSSNASDRTLSNLSDRSNGSDGQPFPTVVAGSRRNSPPGPGPNNVHRVQLDFKPSMEDELELRAGTLVRMLHEYDDGWALCIRLDRSQQGVVPRTCISKLPVKPRAGPPPPSARGPPPQQGRPRGPANAPGPRPAPNGPARGPPPAGRMRSQSNSPNLRQGPYSPASAQGGPQPRPRSNSDATARPLEQAPANAGAPAVMPARKPVPGQAL